MKTYACVKLNAPSIANTCAIRQSMTLRRRHKEWLTLWKIWWLGIFCLCMAGSQRLGCDTIHSMVLYVILPWSWKVTTECIARNPHGQRMRYTHTLACVWLQGFKVAKVVYGKSTHTLNSCFFVPSLHWTGVVLWTWHGIHCLVVMASNTIPLSGKGLQLESL